MEKDKKVLMTYFKNWFGVLLRVKSKISNRMCGISLYLVEMVKFWDEWKCRFELVDLI